MAQGEKGHKKSLLADIRERGVFRMLFILGAGVLGGLALAPMGGEITNWLQHLLRPTAEPTPTSPLNAVPYAVLGGTIGAALGAMAINFLEGLIGRWDRMDPGQKVTNLVGLFAGVFAALPFIILLQALNTATVTIALVLIGLMVGFSAITIYALNSMEEILPWYRRGARPKRTGLKVLDTNVVIDGRIYDVARTGFLEGQMYVPGFVLDELQYIADSPDPLRRQRGKRGLDVLRHMQAEFQLETRIHDKHAPDTKEPVDSRLVRIALALGADLVTNDHNLNRVAELQDVKVLNLNDLALAMRSNILPKEKLSLTIIREGNQPGQGVGYLDDGTMVVIEHGRSHVGETLDVTVTQVIQTERGKMVFADVEGEEEDSEEDRRRRISGRRQH